MEEQERRFSGAAFQNIQRQRVHLDLHGLDLHGSPVQLCIYDCRPGDWHGCCQTRLSEYLKWQPGSAVTIASTSTWAIFGAGVTWKRFGRTGARKCESLSARVSARRTSSRSPSMMLGHKMVSDLKPISRT